MIIERGATDEDQIISETEFKETGIITSSPRKEGNLHKFRFHDSEKKITVEMTNEYFCSDVMKLGNQLACRIRATQYRKSAKLKTRYRIIKIYYVIPSKGYAYRYEEPTENM